MQSHEDVLDMSVKSTNADISIQTSPPPPRKKRKRTIVLPEDIAKLEAMFNANQWPSRSAKEALATDLKKTEHFVSIWFQNRRARARRDGTNMWNRINKFCTQQVSGHSDVIGSGSYESELKTDSGESGMSEECLSESEPTEVIIEDEEPSEMEDDDHSQKEIGHSQPAGHAVDPQSKVMTIMVANKDRCPLPKRESSASDDCEPPGKVICMNRTLLSMFGKISATNKEAPDETVAAVVKDTKEEASVESQESAGSFKGKNTSMIELIRCAKKPDTNFSTLVPVTTYKRPVSLFEAIVNMVAVVEGGIVRLDDPDFPAAANDAINGITINNTFKLVYDKDKGLQFVPLITDKQ